MAEQLLFAHTVEEAIALKDNNAAFLSGGTEINRLDSSVDAKVLIAIKKIPGLTAITEDNDILWLGAAVTFQSAVEHPLVPEWFREACLLMASRTKRNMATLGGNVALLRDDSYIVPALIADKARIVFRDGAEERELCICGYLKERQEGRLADALIVKIGLDTGRKVLLKRYANTAMSHSVLNVACGVKRDGRDLSIGVAAKNCGLFRLAETASAIEKNPGASEEDIVKLIQGCEGPAFADDMFGSAGYKRYLLGTTVARMVTLAR